jgi:hypothetical protein
MTVKLPIVVRCNNVGAIFMAKNSSSGVCTRHVDTRYHFICEHMFVKSCDNNADLFTKNVSKDNYNEVVGKFLGKVDEELEKQI